MSWLNWGGGSAARVIEVKMTVVIRTVQYVARKHFVIGGLAALFKVVET